MSRVVRKFPAENRGCKAKYPYDLWLDTRVHVLTEEDFDSSLASIRGGLFAQAKKRGLKVRTAFDYETGELYVQAYKETWIPKTSERAERQY